MRTLALLTLLLLSACDSAAPAPSAADGLRMDGLDGARVGMSLTEAQAALGPLAVPEGAEANGCFYTKSEKYPGVFIMMTDGAVQRIDVREGATSTETGIRIGDPAAKVTEAYGARVETLPHKYESESGAQYLTVYDDTKSRAVRFVTSGGRIASFHAGNAEQVQYVEGCG